MAANKNLAVERPGVLSSRSSNVLYLFLTRGPVLGYALRVRHGQQMMKIGQPYTAGAPHSLVVARESRCAVQRAGL